jgi:hypothetical protein
VSSTSSQNQANSKAAQVPSTNKKCEGGLFAKAKCSFGKWKNKLVGKKIEQRPNKAK